MPQNNSVPPCALLTGARMDAFLGERSGVRRSKAIGVHSLGPASLLLAIHPRGTRTCMLRHSSRVQLCETPGTMAHQAPLSTGLFWQEYCSGLPFSPPGDLPNPGIEPVSPVAPALARRFFTTEPLGSPLFTTAQRKQPKYPLSISYNGILFSHKKERKY